MENSHLNDLHLFEYASDELSHAERVTAEHHLAGCEECRSLLALSQVGQQALRRAPHFELPAGALGRTLSALGSQDALAPSQPAGFPLRRWLTVLAPAAAIAGVVVVVIFAARGGDGDSVASESAQPTPAAAEAPADFAPNDESTPAAADPSAVAADSARAPTAAAAESSGSADLEAAQDQALFRGARSRGGGGPAGRGSGAGTGDRGGSEPVAGNTRGCARGAHSCFLASGCR